MFSVLMAFLAAIRASVHARAELEAEILALRHQLVVLHRASRKRPHLAVLEWADRRWRAISVR